MKTNTIQDRNLVQRTRRLRKKMKVGEFTQFGFLLKIKGDKSFTKKDIDNINTFANIYEFKIIDIKQKVGKRSKFKELDITINVSSDKKDILSDESNFLSLIENNLSLKQISYSDYYDINYDDQPILTHYK